MAGTISNCSLSFIIVTRFVYRVLYVYSTSRLRPSLLLLLVRSSRTVDLEYDVSPTVPSCRNGALGPNTVYDKR